MEVISKLEAEARAAVSRAGGDVMRVLGREQPAPPQQPQPTFTARQQSQQSPSSQPEVPMTASALLADAEKAAAALVKHVATLAGNPLVDAVIEAGLGMVLTPGEVAAVVAFVRAVEADRTPAAPPSPAQPQADGTGAQQAAQPQARTAPAVV